MRLALVGMLVIVFAFTPSAHAADVAAGEAKAEICAGCHGDDGISQTEDIPSLAGQPDQFIQWQLVYFRAGSRKNEQMQPIVEQLNNEDIRNLGAYFASLTPPKGPKDDNPDLSEKGKQAAAGRRCASCHTDGEQTLASDCDRNSFGLPRSSRVGVESHRQISSGEHAQDRLRRLGRMMA